LEDGAVKIRFGPKKNEGGKEEQIQNQTESHDDQEKNTQDQQGETKKQPESIRHVIKLDNSESETDQKKEQVI
jgi:hypothetical protein